MFALLGQSAEITFLHCASIGNAESAEVSVCPSGQLNLTCNTTEQMLTWSITVPDRPGTERRLILAGGGADSALPLTIGQTTFQFLRTLVSPLISIMVIDNVNTVLNGTRVDCLKEDGVMSTDIINVINIGSGTSLMKAIIIASLRMYDVHGCYIAVKGYTLCII